MQGMYAQPLHPDYLHNVWPLVKFWLASGLKHGAGEYNVDQLKVFIQQGQHVLFSIIDDEGRMVGAGTVAIENYPNARIGFITSLGGVGVLNSEVFESLADWARNNGCTSIRGAVRPSMARLCKKAGFGQQYIIVEHKL